MTEFKDFFISYGRRESLGFAARLHRELKLAGYDAWFDKVNIPDGDDYAERISHGIESAHNFLIVMAPRCMTSPYCLIELEYARILGKRVIPVNQMVIFDTPEQMLSEGDRQVLVNFYRHHGVPDPDIRTTQDVLNRCHFLIGATDWLDAKEILTDADCDALTEWARPYENFWHRHDDPEYLRTLDPEIMCFGERIDELSGVVERVVTVTERQKSYVHTHTEILSGALRWHKNQRAGRFLLTGKKRQAAEAWLLTVFRPPNQPPCKSSDLHCDFICESRKNAENMMTDVFICCDEKDRRIRDHVIRSLSKYAVTAWIHDKDILKGADSERAVHTGIENADNFFYFTSPGSAASEYCRKELEHALQYNKRLVPLLIEKTPETEVPEALRGLLYTDFTDNECQEDYDRDIDDIRRILDHDRAYYKDHKILLSRALKWDAENRIPSFLLRGYNLENAKIWLRLNNKREQHPPTDLHRELITASEAAKGQLGTDVFISYSRKDGDFARKLNMALQEAGKTTWFDQESISKGVDFGHAIYDGIKKSDNFLFVISPDAVNSGFCADEVAYAAEHSKRFIPVLHRKTDPAEMPEAMRRINWINFEKTPFDGAFPEVIRAVELDREHARMHTVLQRRAAEWAENERSAAFMENKTGPVGAEETGDEEAGTGRNRLVLILLSIVAPMGFFTAFYIFGCMEFARAILHIFNIGIFYGDIQSILMLLILSFAVAPPAPVFLCLGFGIHFLLNIVLIIFPFCLVVFLRDPMLVFLEYGMTVFENLFLKYPILWAFYILAWFHAIWVSVKFDRTYPKAELLLPPIRVFLHHGFGILLLLNILLTLLGYIPGLIHAIGVVRKSDRKVSLTVGAILPPAGVFLHLGFGMHFWLSIILLASIPLFLFLPDILYFLVKDTTISKIMSPVTSWRIENLAIQDYMRLYTTGYIMALLHAIRIIMKSDDKKKRASERGEDERSDEFLMNKTACLRSEIWAEEADRDRKQPAPTPLQREFISKSRAFIDSAEKAETRRRRLLTTGLIFALILAAFTLRQWNVAKAKTKTEEKINYSLNQLIKGLRFKNSIGMEFVLIPPGIFMMGSPPDEYWRGDENQHQVTLTKGFYMQTTEVTRGQWKAVMGNAPSDFTNCGDECPVEEVSWEETQVFIRKLNEMEKPDKYRLPTEAEWEYAARAGSNTAYCFGNSEGNLSRYAWYEANSENLTHPVGQLEPNSWGLSDMHGNVWEWCQDRYGSYPSGSVIDPVGPEDGPDHVIRGGAWSSAAYGCRSACRVGSAPDLRRSFLGFRLVRLSGQQELAGKQDAERGGD